MGVVDDIFDDWRWRYSRLFLSGGKWRVHVTKSDGTRGSRRWHWWSLGDLMRMGMHWLWVRKYW